MPTHITFHTAPHLLVACLVSIMAACSASADEPITSPSWYGRTVQRLKTTWSEGQPELYVPLHTYHIRRFYTQEKINSFNETPWGLGLGKGFYDPDGDWHGVYAMVFKDSHSKPEYFAGYGYKTYWPIYDEVKFGLGYIAFVTARADIGHYTPLPAVLPTVTLEYRKFSFDTLYVPGGHNRGNILIFWSKYHFR